MWQVRTGYSFLGSVEQARHGLYLGRDIFLRISNATISPYLVSIEASESGIASAKIKS